MMLASNQLYIASDSYNDSNSLNVLRPESPQRCRFTKEEDYLLKLLVSSQPQPKWSEIATHFQNRTARQCRERYNNYLRPDLVNGPWTKEEDQLLIELFEKHGPKWSLIAQNFESRSSVNVKNHHSSLVNQSSLKKSKSITNTFKIELPRKEIVVHPVQSFNENKFLKENAKISQEQTQSTNNDQNVEMTVVQNPSILAQENMIENEEIKFDSIDSLNENEIEIPEEEVQSFIDEEIFQNMFSSFQVEEDMWATNLSNAQEDDLFAF